MDMLHTRVARTPVAAVRAAALSAEADTIRAGTPAFRRTNLAMLCAGFSTFALVLASLGIYGVISYSVNRRTQEIGIRMALGAQAGDMQARIVLQTLKLAAIGIVLGMAASWALARTIGSLLFGVSAADPVTYLGMLAVLTAVAATAGYLPARRASRIDPATVLRAE